MSNDHELGVIPVDQMVGGDGDTPGLSQPVTSDEVQDIMMSEKPREERVMRLRELRMDLARRQGADMGGEFDSLIAEIDDAIATLNGPADTVGMRDSLGLAADERAEFRERNSDG